MKKYLFTFGWLLVAIYSCDKQRQDDTNLKTANNDEENYTFLSPNAIREVVQLESGIFVETDGENYFLQSDILLSDYQLKTLREKGIFESPVFEESEENTLPVSLASGMSKSMNTKETMPRSIGLHPSLNRAWAMVRYTLAPNLDEFTRFTIRQAIIHWESTTNVRFYNATGQPTVDPTFGFAYPYVEFVSSTINASSIGRIGGRQVLQLITDPPTFRAAAHEIGHAIGLYHEHQRPDRNNFLIFNRQNIVNLNANQIRATFDIIPTNYVMFGAFDFNSIMMYGSYQGGSTVVGPVLTRRDGSTFDAPQQLSPLDRVWANTFYAPYIARSDAFAELAPIVYRRDNTIMSAAERLQFQSFLNTSRGLPPNPPNCCRIPNNH